MNEQSTPEAPKTETAKSATVLTPTTSPVPDNKFAKTVGIGVVVLALLGSLGAAVVLNKNAETRAKSAESKAASLASDLEKSKKELSELKEATGEADIKKDGFQAVFLKGGQVYFGKITKITTTQITLENIYYLRTNGAANSSIADINNPGGNDVSLVKLGEELHGPEDVMRIERINVDFWENLKDDGQVVKAIKEYEKQNP